MATAEPAERRRLIEPALRADLAAALRCAEADVDPTVSVTTLGLDSLAAIRLANAWETRYGVALDLVLLLQGPSLRELAEHIGDRITATPPTPDVPAIHGDHGETADPPTRPARDALSYGQEALWYLQQVAPESAAYNVAAAMRIRGPLDVEALRACFQALVDRHATLRTSYVSTGGAPVPVVHDRAAAAFVLQDAPAELAALQQRLAEEAHRPFDLARDPLLRVHVFRLGSQEHALLFIAHHIAIDLWSLGVLYREMAALYTAACQGTPVALPSPTPTYAELARAQRARLAGPAGERLWTYWRDQLAGDVPPLELPTDRPRPAVQTYNGASNAFQVDPRITRALKALSQRQGATLYVTLLAAFQALLYRYTRSTNHEGHSAGEPGSGVQDVVVGSPTSGRSGAALAGVVGYFVNPVALRSRVDGAQPFSSFLQQVRRTVLDGLAHQDFPFPLLVERLQPQRDPRYSPLFQTMFILQRDQEGDDSGLAALALGETGAAMRLHDLTVEALPIEQRVAQFDLTLALAEVNGGLVASLQYNSDLFDAATAARMSGHFVTLLESIAADPERRIADLPLLTAAERHQVLVEWNETAVSYPDQGLIHELFERQAGRSPDAVAVEFEDQRLTYRDLDARANHLAHYLRRVGAGRGTLVGVCAERSIELVVALMGVLKAGAAYVPLDPTYPPDRLAYMLADSRAPVLLTQQRLEPLLDAALASSAGGPGPERARAPHVIRLDADWQRIAAEPATAPGVSLQPDDPAYVIYTSGSTGRPKGAMNTHGGIRNRLLWMQGAYALSAADRVLQKTPFSFDVSVWEFFWPLLAGARLVVARRSGHLDSAYLALTIVDRGITTLHFVPSMLRLFLEELGLERCTTLRRVICSGEALPVDVQERFFARMPAGVELHNLYGPTEAAVDVTSWQCRPGASLRSVPIGKPIANTRLYVLDPEGQPVPVGVPGELYIGGAGVARGYLHKPELTAQRFVPDPFSGDPAGRLYRTGDLVSYLPDGALVFHGRLDFQVKLRGQRIELAEIEAALRGHEAVRDVVVILHEPVPGDARLVAYVVSNYAEPPDAGTLREYLRRLLPEQMVPAAFEFLPSLPLSPNGKLDRRALPVPDRLPAGRAEGARNVDAPRDALERQVAAAWSEILGLPEVGIHERFFDLGGHSLLTLRLLARIEVLVGQRLAVATFLQAPTVAGMAASLRATGIHPAREVATAGATSAAAPGAGTLSPALVPLRTFTAGTSDEAVSRAPLFCATAGYGDLLALASLAEHLDSTQPVYALQPPGENGHPAPLAGTESLASTYVEAIRSVQPAGPYYLSGYSIGGLAAFEAARQLRAAGHTVAFVGLFDTLYPIASAPIAAAYSFMQKLAPLVSKAAVAAEMFDDAALAAQIGAARGYEPRPYDGFLTLFVAKELSARFSFSSAKWRKIALGGAEVVLADGRHDTMIRRPHVAALAALLAQHLQR